MRVAPTVRDHDLVQLIRNQQVGTEGELTLCRMLWMSAQMRAVVTSGRDNIDIGSTGVADFVAKKQNAD